MTTYYDSNTHTQIAIPKAEYYVLSNDSFMSGWGQSRNPINICVVPCDTYEEAERVERYVRTRSEQKRVRIASSVHPKAHVLYSLVLGWKDRANENRRIGNGECD